VAFLPISSCKGLLSLPDRAAGSIELRSPLFFFPDDSLLLFFQAFSKRGVGVLRSFCYRFPSFSFFSRAILPLFLLLDGDLKSEK